MDLLVHARCNYWLDRPAEWFRAKEKKGYFITNGLEDVHVLRTLYVPIKRIVYVAQSADEALEVLEFLEEKCPDGACRIVEGNVFDVAYEYKKQVVGFFVDDSEKVPEEDDIKLFGRLFQYLDDNTYVGFRFPSKPLPPVLAKKVDNICELTRKRLDIMEMSTTPILRSSSADFSSLLSDSLDPFSVNDLLTIKPRSVHYRPVIFMTETIDGVLCETSGGIYMKKQLGESLWGLQDRVRSLERPRSLDINESNVTKYFDNFFRIHSESTADFALDGNTVDHLSQMHGLPEAFLRECWLKTIQFKK